MQRRDFLKSGVALAVGAELGTNNALGIVPAHNWGKYDFGSGPTVTDRLNQGPFSQYPPDASIPTDEVVMTTTPSEEGVPNYGKGENGVTNLSVAPFPAGRPQWQLTTAGGCQATWSTDGHEPFFVSGNKVYAMPVKDPNNFKPVPPQELFEIPTNITGGGMMRDGKHFLGFRATGATRGGEINVIVNWRVPQSR